MFIHFVTYGDGQYANSKKRLINEARSTGWFKTVRAFGSGDLTEDFKERYREILKQKRGGGYWIWKLDVFAQALSTMNEGDILVYLDAGCEINAKAEKRFRQYIDMLAASPFDMLAFRLSHKEYVWTTDKIFRAFGIEDISNQVRQSGQFMATVQLIQKGPHQRKWLEMINQVQESDPWLITDRYNKDAKRVCPAFRDNRHDQSLFSVSRKIIGCVELEDETYPPRQTKRPFWASRRRG